MVMLLLSEPSLHGMNLTTKRVVSVGSKHHNESPLGGTPYGMLERTTVILRESCLMTVISLTDSKCESSSTVHRDGGAAAASLISWKIPQQNSDWHRDPA